MSENQPVEDQIKKKTPLLEHLNDKVIFIFNMNA